MSTLMCDESDGTDDSVVDGFRVQAFAEVHACPANTCGAMFATPGELEDHLATKHSVRLMPAISPEALERISQPKPPPIDEAADLRILAAVDTPSTSSVMSSAPTLSSVAPEPSDMVTPPDTPAEAPSSQGDVIIVPADVAPQASAEQVARLVQMEALGLPHHLFGDALPEGWTTDIHERQDRPGGLRRRQTAYIGEKNALTRLLSVVGVSLSLFKHCSQFPGLRMPSGCAVPVHRKCAEASQGHLL